MGRDGYFIRPSSFQCKTKFRTLAIAERPAAKTEGEAMRIRKTGWVALMSIPALEREDAGS
jgi:hypothetical protein